MIEYLIINANRINKDESLNNSFMISPIHLASLNMQWHSVLTRSSENCAMHTQKSSPSIKPAQHSNLSRACVT